MNFNCTDCNKTYQAYLSDLPSEWRKQIADLMCKVVEDVSGVECEDVKACETLTSLSPFTLEDTTLSITYRDERGVSTTRSVDLGFSPEDDFIQNQFDGAQSPGTFWIDGMGRLGGVDVTDDAIPENGIYLPATDTIGIAANSTLITTIEAVNGLLTHKGNIFLDAAISATPGISFFLNSFTGQDYYLQRNGTTLDLHAAGLVRLSSNLTTFFDVNQNSNRGFEMVSGGLNLFQMFPTGEALFMVTNVQQTPDTSAIVEMDSTTQGFLPPRMTSVQRAAIASPSEGLIVYDLDLQKLCVYTTGWETITSV